MTDIERQLRSMQASISMPATSREMVEQDMFAAFDVARSGSSQAANPGHDANDAIQLIPINAEGASSRRRPRSHFAIAAVVLLVVGVVSGLWLQRDARVTLETADSAELPSAATSSPLLEGGRYGTELLGNVSFEISETLLLVVAEQGHVRLADPDDLDFALDLVVAPTLSPPIGSIAGTQEGPLTDVAQWVRESTGFLSQQLVANSDRDGVRLRSWSGAISPSVECPLPGCPWATTAGGSDLILTGERNIIFVAEPLDGDSRLPVIGYHHSPQTDRFSGELPFSDVLASLRFD